MKPFGFCPACATRLADPDDEGGLRCPGCGRTWYQPFAPTAGAVIVRDGRALVTVRARDPEKGRIDVPGGFLRPGEDPLEGLRREVDEELGIAIDVGPDDYLQAAPHTYGSEGDWVLSLGFRARWAAGEPRPADDVADIRWVTRAELDGLDWAWEHDRDLVRKALDHG
jgi:NADH pyrophosphatase NudC (nudix superfamily)